MRSRPKIMGSSEPINYAPRFKIQIWLIAERQVSADTCIYRISDRYRTNLMKFGGGRNGKTASIIIYCLSLLWTFSNLIYIIIFNINIAFLFSIKIIHLKYALLSVGHNWLVEIISYPLHVTWCAMHYALLIPPCVRLSAYAMLHSVSVMNERKW